MQSVNVEAALWLCQVLTPAMIARGFGRIIFITSNTVWRPPAADFLPYVASKALPRSLVPDDVAGLVAFLASDAAAAITGQTLCADGGSVFA